MQDNSITFVMDTSDQVQWLSHNALVKMEELSFFALDHHNRIEFKDRKLQACFQRALESLKCTQHPSNPAPRVSDPFLVRLNNQRLVSVKMTIMTSTRKAYHLHQNMPCSARSAGSILVEVSFPSSRKLAIGSFQEHLKLTPAEAELVAALHNGETLNRFADTKQIRQDTARKCLKSVFEKAGVNKQTQLISMMNEYSC